MHGQQYITVTEQQGLKDNIHIIKQLATSQQLQVHATHTKNC
jgi:hypothetical protein